MPIFVLVGEWDYAAHQVLGAYASREDAVAAYEEYVRGEDGYDHYYIEPRVLGDSVYADYERQEYLDQND